MSWTESFPNVFCSPCIVPKSDAPLGSQMNALTRLVFALFVVFLLAFRTLLWPVVFLVISVVFLFVFYYTKKARMKPASVEHYSRTRGPYPDSRRRYDYDATEEYTKLYTTDVVCDKLDPVSRVRGSFTRPITYLTKHQTVSSPARATLVPNPITSHEDLVIKRPTAFTFCDDAIPVYGDNPNHISVIPNQLSKHTSGTYLPANASQAGNTPVSNWQSLNQRLAGAPNPKTLLPPVIVPPPMELEYWKASNLTTHSHINDMKSIDEYLSGYQVSTCCGGGITAGGANIVGTEAPLNPAVVYSSCGEPLPHVKDPPALYMQGKASVPKSSTGYKKAKYRSNFDNSISDYTYGKEKFEKARADDRKAKLTENYGCCGAASGTDYDIIDSPIPEYHRKADTSVTMDEDRLQYPYEIRAAQPGQVDTECGYDPEQLRRSNIPSNVPTGQCERSREMADYNKALYTQTIQPGVYSYNEVNEPIQSNMGISFDQQLEPLTISSSGDGGSVLFTRQDPRLISEIIDEPDLETVNAANVYDPRLTGYGSADRSYQNDLLGRVDYYYDDVNAARAPNYITRSKIDMMKGADTFGTMMTPTGTPYTEYIHALADNEFTKCALQFRTGMQESLMRKNNAISWQRRSRPLGRHQ